MLQHLLRTSALTKEEREFSSVHPDWCSRHAERLHPPYVAGGLTLDAFASVVRTAKLMPQRIVFGCLAFTGYIDVWLGGPPSPTVSAAIFEPLAGDPLFVGSRVCL